MNYLSKINQIKKAIKIKKEEIETLTADWCEAEHPLRIGDNVEVNGYSHRGKRMIVSAITIYFGFFGPEWQAIGAVLKKNGDPGLSTGEWKEKI